MLYTVHIAKFVLYNQKLYWIAVMSNLIGKTSFDNKPICSLNVNIIFEFKIRWIFLFSPFT